MRYALKTLLLLTFLSASFAFSNLDANAQTFLPVGPQTNVPVATVTGGGWTECYRDLYGNVFLNPDVVLPQCPGNRLMLACRQTGSPTLQLLAQGARSDVTFDTGASETSTHIANGVGWYFNFPGGSAVENGQNAWGFVRAGDSVNKNNCDLDFSGANNERLCWHLNNDNGGFRCGADTFLNDSTTFERIVYTNSPSRPIPTLSEWGLIAMAGVLGIIGLLALKRRKVTA